MDSAKPRLERLEHRDVPAGQVLVPGTAVRTASQQFVAQCYEDILSRPADAAGLAFWSRHLDAGVPRSTVAQALIQSDEGRLDTVRTLFGNLLGRAPDAEALRALPNTLGGPGTVEDLKALVLGSPEYFQGRGAGTNAGFLRALFNDVLDRAPDAAATSHFEARLAAGAERARIAAEVIESAEGREHTITELYRRYLFRLPDVDGLKFFAATLAGAGSVTGAEANILGSAECAERPTRHPDDVVLTWNAILLDAIRADRTAPPRASRLMAIVQTAVADAVFALSGLGTFYAATPTPPIGASREAAAAAVAHRTLSSLFPAQAATFDAALTASLTEIPEGAARNDGIAFGRAVADAAVARRANDGSDTTVTYTPGTGIGVWVPTPTAFAAALLPQWPNVTPFVMASGSQFRPATPPTPGSTAYATDYNEVKSLGKIDSTTRTADQTEIAFFWANGAGTFTPPGHWNAIARDVAVARGNTLTENARMLAALDLAEADAAIVSWDAKYATNYWRPVTAIRADDGNPATEADATWSPLLATPPFPTYTSGHSTFSGAADAVLSAFFGSNVAFTTRSDESRDIVRSFTSFAQAADESGRSRIYGGIHFEFDNVTGLASGRALGQFVVQRYLAN